MQIVEGLLAQVVKLHPSQETFMEAGAVQCDYCTPGVLMSAQVLLAKHPRPDRAQVKEVL